MEYPTDVRHMNIIMRDETIFAQLRRIASYDEINYVDPKFRRCASTFLTVAKVSDAPPPA
jgi:hypothetical protein